MSRFAENVISPALIEGHLSFRIHGKNFYIIGICD